MTASTFQTSRPHRGAKVMTVTRSVTPGAPYSGTSGVTNSGLDGLDGGPADKNSRSRQQAGRTLILLSSDKTRVEIPPDLDAEKVRANLQAVLSNVHTPVHAAIVTGSQQPPSLSGCRNRATAMEVDESVFL